MRSARFGKINSATVDPTSSIGRLQGPQKHSLVCLMGTVLDSGDLGVVAASTALVGLVREHCPEARIVLMIEHPSGESQTARFGEREILVEVVPGRLDPRRPLWNHLLIVPLLALAHRIRARWALPERRPSRSPWVDTLQQATWVGDLQGGDGFTDEHGVWNFVAGTLPTLAAIAAGRSPYLLPQSYGPHQSALGMRWARFIARRCRGLFARDLAGVQVAISLAGRFPAPPVEFCPDLAFVLPLAPLPADAITPALPDGVPVFGLNVHGGRYTEGFSRKPSAALRLDYAGFIPEVARALLESEPNAHVLMVPYTAVPAGHPENDVEACEHVAATLPDALRARVHGVHGLREPSQINAAIARCDFFVGSRLHACIAALSQGVPCVAVADNWRFEGVFASAGMQGSVVDARYDEAVSALRFVLQQARERGQIRERLAPAIAPIRDRIHETFARLLAPSRRPL